MEGNYDQFANNVSDSCVYADVDYQADNIVGPTASTNWQHCREMCQNYQGCAAWSYTEQKCWIKGPNYKSNIVQLEGIISGTMFCGKMRYNIEKEFLSLDYFLRKKLLSQQITCFKARFDKQLDAEIWYFLQHNSRKNRIR